MSTLMGSGVSRKADAAGAAEEAVAQALLALEGKQPHLTIVFASTVYDYAALLRAIKGKVGSGEIVGCSTAGEFNQTSAGSDGVSVAVLWSDAMDFKVTAIAGVKANPAAAVRNAFARFEDETKESWSKGLSHTTVMMLMDGFLGQGEELVQTIFDRVGVGVQIAGGAAGDDGKFKKTHVFHGTDALTDAVVFVKIFSKSRLGIGVRHGMRACTPNAHVTKSVKNVLHTIDNKPAIEFYRIYAKSKNIDLTPENTNAYLIANELAIQAGAFTKVRAPLSVNADGSLNMATEVPEGSLVTIVDADPGELLTAATEASREAKVNLKGENTAGLIVFDCICRKIILGKDFGKEVEALRHVHGAVPVAGFATYGEIARFGGKFNGFHNSTTVVLAIPK